MRRSPICYTICTMTRQVRLPSALLPDKLLQLRRLSPSRNLTDAVVDQLAAEIRQGRLAPGSRLPTEQELTTVLGVSRTVVREAISALRAEGLVLTRQGSGAYVAPDASRVPFRISADGSGSIAGILKIMELRLAIEVEAAALAAERASAQQVGAIERALLNIDRAIGRGEGAVKEDFDFHRSIADATGNSQFAQFLEFLGRYVIPRQSIRLHQGTPDDQRRYLELIQAEHRKIAAALKARDPLRARRAMRVHLSKSLERYRKFARQMGSSSPKQ
jgi:GntR family transcriptional regulator, transcriptional repressor for pyruvate dehydrogenase complex